MDGLVSSPVDNRGFPPIGGVQPMPVGTLDPVVFELPPLVAAAATGDE
jgi:hypothetical protein